MVIGGRATGGQAPRGAVRAFSACKTRRAPAISDLRDMRLLGFCGGPLTRGRLLFRVAFSSIGCFWAPSPYAWAGSRTTDCPCPHPGLARRPQPYLVTIFLFCSSGIGQLAADRNTSAAGLLFAYGLVDVQLPATMLKHVVVIDDVRLLRVYLWQVVAIDLDQLGMLLGQPVDGHHAVVVILTGSACGCPGAASEAQAMAAEGVEFASTMVEVARSNYPAFSFPQVDAEALLYSDSHYQPTYLDSKITIMFDKKLSSNPVFP